MTFFPRLHWLRGLLALTVVTCHVSLMLQPRVVTPLLRCGLAAVPVFFVLSGFVMYQAVRSSPVGMRAALGFFAKRVLRIFPAYWFFLALTALLVLSGRNTWDFARAPDTNWSAGWTLFTSQLDPHLPIGASWSLIYEVMFYYALVLLVWNRRLGAVACAIYFGASLLLTPWIPLPLYGWTPTVGLFLAGLGLGLLNEKAPSLLRPLAPLLPLGLLLILVYVVTGLSFHTLLYRLPAIPLVAGILALEHTQQVRTEGGFQNVLQFLGTISFSLYVGHTLVQSVLLPWMGIPTLLTVPVFIGVPIFVAFASFTCIEKPAMRLAKWIDSRCIDSRRDRDVPETRELEVAPSLKPL